MCLLGLVFASATIILLAPVRLELSLALQTSAHTFAAHSHEPALPVCPNSLS